MQVRDSREGSKGRIQVRDLCKVSKCGCQRRELGERFK